MKFPRFLYHEDVKGGRLFSSPDELEAAGEGWQNTPVWVRGEINPDEWRRVKPLEEPKEEKEPMTFGAKKLGRPKKG